MQAPLVQRTPSWTNIENALTEHKTEHKMQVDKDARAVAFVKGVTPRRASEDMTDAVAGISKIDCRRERIQRDKFYAEHRKRRVGRDFGDDYVFSESLS